MTFFKSAEGRVQWYPSSMPPWITAAYWSGSPMMSHLQYVGSGPSGISSYVTWVWKWWNGISELLHHQRITSDQSGGSLHTSEGIKKGVDGRSDTKASPTTQRQAIWPQWDKNNNKEILIFCEFTPLLTFPGEGGSPSLWNHYNINLFTVNQDVIKGATRAISLPPVSLQHKSSVWRWCTCSLRCLDSSPSAGKVKSHQLVCLRCLLDSTSALHRSLFPPSCLIDYSVSCSWAFSCLVLINKTCLCACSLASPASRCAPQPYLWAHAELMKHCRLMAFAHWEQKSALWPARGCSFIWKVLGSHSIFSLT